MILLLLFYAFIDTATLITQNTEFYITLVGRKEKIGIIMIVIIVHLLKCHVWSIKHFEARRFRSMWNY